MRALARTKSFATGRKAQGNSHCQGFEVAAYVAEVYWWLGAKRAGSKRPETGMRNRDLPGVVAPLPPTRTVVQALLRMRQTSLGGSMPIAASA